MKIYYFGGYKKNRPWQIHCQGRIHTYPRCHLASQIHAHFPRSQQIPGYWRKPNASHTTEKIPFAAPSAVHLTSRFPPGFQHPGLSVEALLPLFPHQRFDFLYHSTRKNRCQREIPICRTATNWNGEVCLTASEVWFAPSEVCLTASEVATLWQLWCAHSALIEIVGVADTFTFSVGENFPTK